MYTNSWNSGNHFMVFWMMDFRNDTSFWCSASLSDNSILLLAAVRIEQHAKCAPCPNFKVVEFDHFRMSAGLPSFVLSASEWIERTNAVGIIVKKGRYGGTYAHKDIAFEFGSAISVPFKLYLIEEFQRLKTEEQKLLGWSAKRELSKINYRIHTDAIKNHLLPAEITREQASYVYADEADVLNVAMFGKTARQWREENPDLKGNIRDYASINELICLSNMENLNAVFIEQGMPQSERLVKLNQIAIHQMSILESDNTDRKLLK